MKNQLFNLLIKRSKECVTKIDYLKNNVYILSIEETQDILNEILKLKEEIVTITNIIKKQEIERSSL